MFVEAVGDRGLEVVFFDRREDRCTVEGDDW